VPEARDSMCRRRATACAGGARQHVPEARRGVGMTSRSQQDSGVLLAARSRLALLDALEGVCGSALAAQLAFPEMPVGDAFAAGGGRKPPLQKAPDAI